MSISNYYPFGMQMPGMSWNEGDGYWYGFGSHENDDEVYGDKNFMDFGGYGYDNRLGRRWNVEPEWKKVVFLSNYATFNNNPILYKDPTGQVPIETVSDVGFVLYDLSAGIYYEITGDDEAANSAWIDLGLDGTALVIPYVPAGISKLRYADEVVDAVSTGDKLLEGTKSTEKISDKISNLKKVDVPGEGTVLKPTPGKSQTDFIVTPDGTTVPTDYNRLYERYTNAGSNKVQETPNNYMFELPKADGNGTFYSRRQKGNSESLGPYSGERVVNTRNTGNPYNKDYVNPDGSNIRSTKLNPVTTSQREEKGHIHLEQKK